MDAQRNSPAEAGPGKRGASGYSGGKYNTPGISDAMLAEHLATRRSKVWAMVARGDIPPPDSDNNICMSWTPASFGRIQRDLAAGRMVLR